MNKQYGQNKLAGIETQEDAGLVLQDLYHYALALAHIAGIKTDDESSFIGHYGAQDLARLLRSYGVKGRSYSELAIMGLELARDLARVHSVDPYTSHIIRPELTQRIEGKIAEIDGKIAVLRRMQLSHARVAVSHGNTSRMVGKVDTLIAVLIDERNDLADLIWKS